MTTTEKMEDNNMEKQMKFIHIVPNLSDIERERAGKCIGNELYEIFIRILAELKSLKSGK